MVFEVYAEGLGAQKQVCGGGSYQLIRLFGGGDVPSTGFGIGFDRIMEICNIETEEVKPVAIISMDSTRLEAIHAASKLRPHVPVYIDLMERTFKAQLSYANYMNASHVLIIGDNEVRAGKVTLKDMQSGEQELLTMEEVLLKLCSHGHIDDGQEHCKG